MISGILILHKCNSRLSWRLLTFPSKPDRYVFFFFFYSFYLQLLMRLALQLHHPKSICDFVIKCSADYVVPGQDIVGFGAELRF